MHGCSSPSPRPPPPGAEPVLPAALRRGDPPRPTRCRHLSRLPEGLRLPAAPRRGAPRGRAPREHPDGVRADAGCPRGLSASRPAARSAARQVVCSALRPPCPHVERLRRGGRSTSLPPRTPRWGASRGDAAHGTKAPMRRAEPLVSLTAEGHYGVTGNGSEGAIAMVSGRYWDVTGCCWKPCSRRRRGRFPVIELTTRTWRSRVARPPRRFRPPPARPPRVPTPLLRRSQIPRRDESLCVAAPSANRSEGEPCSSRCSRAPLATAMTRGR